MGDGKGYYINSSLLSDQDAGVHLVYGKPSTGRTALKSPVQEVERFFVLKREYDNPNRVTISMVPVRGRHEDSSLIILDVDNNTNLQRVFDFYLLQWLREITEYNHKTGILAGISRVLGTKRRDKIKEYMDPDEQIAIELPKVRVEGLEGILEEAAGFLGQ